MEKIAYLCGSTTIPWSTRRRLDAYEHDLAFRRFKPAFAAAGRELVEVLWSDTTIDWGQFEAAIIGSAWDYTANPKAFLSQLSTISAHTTLYNSLELVRWNLEKTYLRELGSRGVTIIPTIWETHLGKQIPDSVFDELQTDKIIIKPIIGACSEGQILIDRGKPQQLDLQVGGAVMLQKFYPSIAEDGEKSFIYFGGQFSHGVLKTPTKGDYRVQSIFDGTERVYTPTVSELRVCENILSKIPAMPMYARIDLIHLPTAELALMECEVIEPYLYPTYAPDASRMIVRTYLSLSQ